MVHRILILALALGACGASGADSRQEAADTSAARAFRGSEFTDSSLRQASGALRGGHPWEATRLLAPVLADSSRRTPDALLLAATAAGAWEGWSEVQRLLTGAPWLDSVRGGHGRELLARAALERRVDTLAAREAERAVAVARDERERGLRLILLGRALDRLDRLDSARAAYIAASSRLPEIGDWLRLRAAGVTRDSAERAQLYARVALAAAKARIAPTEAQTLERTGRIAAAARQFAAMDWPVSNLRLRLALASDAVSRTAVRRELVRLIGDRRGSADARLAIEVLDGAFEKLTPAEELVVARSASRGGPLPRAASAYARAFAAKLGTAQDRFDYGVALGRLDRWREATAQFARVTAPAPLAARAAYERGRAMLRAGDTRRARAALRAVVTRHAQHADAATAALALLADLATDDGRDADARDAYLEIVRRWPRGATTDEARFRAAIIAWAAGNRRAAARELDSLVAVHPRSDERHAALYWSGRAWAVLGDSAPARQRWETVAAAEPLSYYAMLASRRLGRAPWLPPDSGDGVAAIAAVDSAVVRADLLASAGMDVEVRFEWDALADEAERVPGRLLATGAALREHGRSSRAISLGWKAIAAGIVDARAYRLAYPVLHRDVLTALAKARELDPALVAALIRQESSFDPRATSGAGARGLMQVMPRVGAQLARSEGYPFWDPVLLWQPDVNLELGTRHLRGSLGTGERSLPYALAAYNAGSGRLSRWRRKRGVDDPELFVERIPFAETRDYVRIVQRNREMYSGLYRW